MSTQSYGDIPTFTFYGSSGGDAVLLVVLLHLDGVGPHVDEAGAGSGAWYWTDTSSPTASLDTISAPLYTQAKIRRQSVGSYPVFHCRFIHRKLRVSKF